MKGSTKRDRVLILDLFFLIRIVTFDVSFMIFPPLVIFSVCESIEKRFGVWYGPLWAETCWGRCCCWMRNDYKSWRGELWGGTPTQCYTQPLRGGLRGWWRCSLLIGFFYDLWIVDLLFGHLQPISVFILLQKALDESLCCPRIWPKCLFEINIALYWHKLTRSLEAKYCIIYCSITIFCSSCDFTYHYHIQWFLLNP